MVALATPDYLAEEERKKRLALSSALPSSPGGTGAPGTIAPEPPGNLSEKISAAHAGSENLAGLSGRINQGQTQRGSEFGDFLAQKGASFRGATDAGTQNYDAGFVGSTLAGPEKATNEQLARYNLMRTGVYTGPTSLEQASGQEIKGRADRTAALGNIRDQSTLSELVAGAGGGRATGKMALNLNLLGRPEQRETLESGYQRLLAEMAENQARTESESGAYVGQSRARSAETGMRVQGETQGAVTAQEGQNIGARDALRAQTKTKQAAIKRAINTGVADGDTLKTLGITRDQWVNIQTQIQQLKAGVNMITTLGNQDALAGMSEQELYDYYRNQGENAKTARRLAAEHAARLAAFRPTTYTTHSGSPSFDYGALYKGQDPSTITTEQAITPEKGARTEALKRLLSGAVTQAPAAGQYGGGNVPGGIDPAKGREMENLLAQLQETYKPRSFYHV